MRIETTQITKQFYIYTLTAKFKDLIITKNEISFEHNNYGLFLFEDCKERIKECNNILEKQIIKYGKTTLFDLKYLINKYFAFVYIEECDFKCDRLDLKEITDNISDITIKLE